MKALYTLVALTFLVTACEQVNSRDECSLEGLFTSSWWEICV